MGSKTRSKSAKAGPRDVFLNLLVIIFLYMCVFAFVALVFKYIDMVFPDPLRYSYGDRNALRWPLAVLTIVFPLYVWLTVVLQREIKKDSSKRGLKTRRWLIAFTLFITALAIVTDLITLMYRFLGGGLSVPFVLKVASVLVIAISVFLYYGWNFRNKSLPSENLKMRIFARSMVSLGVIAIVTGFFAAGSPISERMRQFDDIRIENLSSLQWEIVNYWRDKNSLPVSLQDLRDSIRGYSAPSDPETGKPYEYRVLGGESFELCAVFNAPSEGKIAERKVPIRPDISDNWRHGAGRQCFERTIDPDRFPPREKF